MVIIMAIPYRKKNTKVDREVIRIMKNKFKSYNVFKFIFYYIFAIFLILSAMGIYSYNYLVKTVYDDFLSGNEQYISAIVSRHENDIQITDNIVTQVRLMDETIRFCLSEKPQNAQELKKTLKGYTTVSQFFDLLLYHYHGDEYLYHYLSSVSKEFLIELGAEFSLISTDKFMELATEKNLRLRIIPEQIVGGAWLNNYLSDKNYVIYFRTISSGLEDTLIFMVPGSYYDKLLTDETADRRIDFLKYDEQIIVTRGSIIIPEEDIKSLLQGEAATASIKQGEVLQQEVKVGETDFLLTVQSGGSGIIYGTLQSLKVYHDKVMTEQWAILMMIMVCMLVAVILVSFTSKGFVNKIKRLNGLLNEDSFYDLDGIESGIQALVTTYKESEKEGIVFKKTRFIRNFIRGDFSDKDEAVSEAQKASMMINYDKYIVILLKSREIMNEDKAYHNMLDVIDQKADLEGYGIHLVNNNQNLFVLYSDSKEEIVNILDDMLKIGKSFSHDYVIACSDCHTDFTEAPKAYLEAVNAFDNYLLLDNSKIIHFSEVAQKEYISMLPDSYLQRLKQAIRSSDKAAVETTIKDICRKFNGENVSLYSFRVFYNDIINILLSEWKGNTTQLDNFFNVFTLSKCSNLEEFGELLCEICNMIVDGYSGKTVDMSSVVERAISYMRENYSDSELTMNSLAEYIGVSSVTLSVEFKNEMDVRPSDYLANLRMEKAKELLKNSDRLIREIRTEVGYENDRVFMRRFKNYTGMTPSEYRNEG